MEVSENLKSVNDLLVGVLEGSECGSGKTIIDCIGNFLLLQ